MDELIQAHIRNNGIDHYVKSIFSENNIKSVMEFIHKALFVPSMYTLLKAV